MKTRHSRQLEGILCVEKPQDWTSFDVVAKMRGIADCHKIGHGGTLDPMATGVLPLFFGRSAKAMELMPNQQKRYTAAGNNTLFNSSLCCGKGVLNAQFLFFHFYFRCGTYLYNRYAAGKFSQTLLKFFFVIIACGLGNLCAD